MNDGALPFRENKKPRLNVGAFMIYVYEGSLLRSWRL